MCMAGGQMFSSIHWSDTLQTDERGFVDQRVLRKTRWDKVRMTNEIMNFYGLSVSERPGGYMISNRKGRSVLCKDFGEIWSNVEKLQGKKVDPLDPALIDYLNTRAS